jgi:hypothetical protein
LVCRVIVVSGPVFFRRIFGLTGESKMAWTETN